MNTQNEAGVVLVFLLFVFSILTLCTLSQWKALCLSQQLMNHYQTTQAGLFRLEKAADEISQKIQQHPLPQQGEWKGVYYRLIFQGNFPCIQLEAWSTAHYLLILNDTANTQLKVRIAKRIPQAPCPLEKRRFVTSEILSWDLF